MPLPYVLPFELGENRVWAVTDDRTETVTDTRVTAIGDGRADVVPDDNRWEDVR